MLAPLTLGLALTASATAAADGGKIVLDRAFVVQRAAAQNPQVASTRAEIARAKARQGQVRAAKFPDIEVLTAVATSLKGDIVDDNGVRSTRSAYDFRWSDLSAAFAGRVSLIQPLWTFGKISLRGEAADHGLGAARAQVDMTKADVAYEAAELYENHLYAKAALLFLKDIEAFAKKSLEETEFLLEEGSPDATPQDKLRLKAAIGLAALGRHRAEAGVDQSLEGLRAYLDLPEGAEIEVAEKFHAPLAVAPSPLEKLVRMALDQRPEFEALNHGILAYQKLADAERADYYPDIFLLGYISAAYTPGRDFVTSRYVLDPLGHFLPAALVGARWTIQWDMAGQRALEIEADATRYAGLLAWAKAGIPAEVNKAYRDVERARRDLKQLDESLPLTKQWMVRAQADFAIGAAESSELTDAVQAYVFMKTAELEAVRDLNIALAELAKVTGTLVSDEMPLYPGPAPEKTTP